MNIEQYYIDALPTKGLRESLLYTQNTIIHYKRCPKLLNSYRNNIIRNALQGAESMQYYYILALLIEY
ncbi:hypothetical protein PBI_121Q_250 [Escherichia phage 121Q]|uniref:Uncharacterized protein n=1 Tax=Escherichia phage 121Q TaxID=1555202 RepID=A0A097EXK5_9CAUD|nr:hypothetical protein PBI_121Q_250 [Escherichia phage 121Q]AIT14140.1 hypothetical protein PBI_121Q_250 [Escherichia phage 121Q]